MSPRHSARRGGRRRRHQLHPLAITTLVVLVVIAITYYAFNQGLPFSHPYTVSAVVSNSVNVRSGDPVRIAGIDVGAVSGVVPDGESSKITFTVQPSGLPLHRDATVRIRDRLFLEGSYYLDLDPGSPGSPTMPDHVTIPQSQTSSPVQFYQVLSTFDVAARASLTTIVGQLSKGFGARPGTPLSESGAAGLKATFPQAKPALKDVARVSQALRGTQPGDVHTLLTSSSQVTGTLGGSASQLADLVHGLNVTAQALVASDGSLGASIQGLDQTLQAAPPALTAIDRMLPPVARLARALDPSLKQAPPLISQLTGVVTQLAQVLAPVERRQLLTALKTTFQNLPTVLTQLGQAFPITKQVTDCLRTHVTPVLEEQVPDGSLSTGRPVWQDFVHFLPGVGSASASFDGNGPYTRVLLAAGTGSVSLGTLGGIGTILGSLPVIRDLPIVGSLVGTTAPGGQPVLGSRPTWVGDPTPSDFRPDVPCSTQPIPSLAATTATSDSRPVHTPAPKPESRSQLLSAVVRADAASNARARRAQTAARRREARR